MLFIDLDDVLADFSGAFRRTFGLEHHGMEDEEFWGLIDSHGSFFRDLPLCAGALPFLLVRAFRDSRYAILTACPYARFADVATQKRAWVREHIGNVPVIFSPGAKHKHHYMHSPGDILIDDYNENIKRWTSAGGRGILHFGNFAATSRTLNDLLCQPTRSAPGTSNAPSAVHGTTSPATTTATLTASHPVVNTVSPAEEKPFRLTPASRTPPNCS